MLDLVDLFKQHSIAAKGAICVGAHIGQDMFLYDRMGFSRAVMVEADAELAAIMFKNVQYGSFQHLKKTYVVAGAVSDHKGEEKFYVVGGNRKQSSSTLRPKVHLEIYPDNKVESEITVPCNTLDELLFSHLSIPSPEEFNFLHMDIQGAEGKALSCAMRLLGQLDAISCEVNYAEMYEGCMPEPELSKALSFWGFDKVAELRGGVNQEQPWGDAFYVRRK